MQKMKVIWPHNFSPEVKNSGNFVFNLAEAIRDLGVCIDLEYLGNLRNFKNFISAKKHMSNKVRNYDIIHSQFGSACGYLVSKLSGTKILSLRGSDWYGSTSGGMNSLIHGFAQRFLTRSSLNKFNRVIVMSNRMASEVGRRCNPEFIDVIPDGIDLTKFMPVDRKIARESMGVGDDSSPWVLFPSVYKTNPVKRLELAMAAFSEAKKVLCDLKFKLISDVDHKDMPMLINACNITLMTSTHEGWSNSIKESLACNVPFVCTDVSDLKQISTQEKSCFVIDADTKLLGAALVKAITQNRPTNLRKYVESMNLEEIARKIVQLYEDVLNNHI